MHLTLIRNATLILDYAGHRLLIDPYFAPKHSLPSYTGRSQNPMVDLPLLPETIIQDVEMVMVSHLHTDHFDETAQDALSKSIPLFCQPGDEERIKEKGFSNVMPIADSVEWEGIQIQRTDGHHGLGAVEALMGKVSGFVFSASNEPTVYWAGDTVLCDEVRQTIADHTPDVIVTHSSGASWPDPDDESERVLIVMDAEQTVATAKFAPKSRLVATHMEALDHATVSRAELRAAANDAGLSPDQFIIPEDGETLRID